MVVCRLLRSGWAWQGMDRYYKVGRLSDLMRIHRVRIETDKPSSSQRRDQVRRVMALLD